MIDRLSLLECFEPVDAAEPDSDFIKKFVTHEDLTLLLRDQTCLITGEKGSGKTALCRYIEEILTNDRCSVVGISFNELRHADITHYISELARLSGIDSLALTSAFWRCVIVISAMRHVFENDKNNISFLETKLVHFLRESGHLEKSPVDTFLHLVRGVWNLFNKITAPDSSGATIEDVLGLPPSKSGLNIDERQMLYLRKYPFSDVRYQRAEQEFATYLKNNDLAIVVYLDGFDKLRGDGPSDTDALNLIFTALTDSVYTIRTEGKWSNFLKIKAFIPHDRWLEQKMRDLDKYRAMQESIVWRYNYFREFLLRRLILHEKVSPSADFQSAWKKFFPESLENNCYGVRESVYDYIIRHTQYRPRQLLYHLINLCKAFKSGDINAQEIPHVIARSCKERVRDFIEEYRIDHPEMESFLTKFRGCPNVLTYSEFRDQVQKALREMRCKDVNVSDKIQKLYHIGFVGLVEEVPDHEFARDRHMFYFPPLRVSPKKYRCEFYYEDAAPEVFRDLNNDDLVCIHPMFFDYCRLNSHPIYMVG